jgi:hypothetical protein
VDGTDSGPCLMEAFSISGVGISGSAITESVCVKCLLMYIPEGADGRMKFANMTLTELCSFRK